MVFKGFVSFYCNKSEIDNKIVDIIDVSDKMSDCMKPRPSFLTKKEYDEYKLKGEETLNKYLDDKEKEWNAWENDKFKSLEAEQQYKKYSDIQNKLFNAAVSLIKKYKWQFNGGAYQDNYVPVFKYKGEYFRVLLSMRTWGSVIYQAKYELSHNNRKDGPDYDPMGYLDWYCSNAEDPIYPDESFKLKELGFDSFPLDSIPADI